MKYFFNMLLVSGFLIIHCAYSGQSEYPSTYEFSFDNISRWSINSTNSTIPPYIESASGERKFLNLESGGIISTLTYDRPIDIKSSYRVKFRALIASYGTAGWPLRVLIKSGAVNLILVVDYRGVSIIDQFGEKQILASSPSVGQWHDYDIKVNYSHAELSIDGGNSIPINSLKFSDQPPMIQLSANALNSDNNVHAKIDHLAVIPDPVIFQEEWDNSSNWILQNNGNYDFSTSLNSVNEPFLNIANGTSLSYWETNNLNIPKQYRLRFGVEVNKYGSKTPISFRIYDGSYRAIITLRKSHIVLTDQSGSPIRLSRHLAVNERAEFELQVINGVAELFEHTVGNTKNSLHKWNLPINKKPSTIRLFTSGTGANSNIYHMYLENRVPLLDNSNNEDAHEFINFTNGEIFGVSQMGGGYGSQLRLSSTGDNLIATGYGAGWVSALRSKLHHGAYNPTQGGASSSEGTETTLSKNGLKIEIAPLATPLFVLDSKTYDWIENEPHTSTNGEVFSDSRVCDNGNSDIDGIDESNLDMLHELRSEMDFSGHWEDSSSLVNTNKSVLRHKAEWSYTRSAANILQFNRESNGIDNTKRVLDLSPTYHNGNQTATDEDLSYLLNTYSYRLKPSEGYRYVMWKENGVWNKLDANKMDVIDPEICTINPCSGNEKCESTRHSKVRLNIFGSKNDALNTAALGSAKVSWGNLANSADASVVILSKTGLVNDVNAIGLVIPFNSAINKNAVIGVDRETGTSVFNEDRRINAYYEAGYTNRGKFLTVFARMWHLGLQAPDNGDENIIETLNMEIYHIFGTPIEIYNSAMDINALP